MHTDWMLILQGKVREIYEAGDSKLLLVASDRISAYDIILDNGVKHKGAVLTLLTNHWLRVVLPKQVPGLKHHLVSLNIPPSLNVTPEEKERLRGRSMLVNKYRVFPVEAIGLSDSLGDPSVVRSWTELIPILQCAVTSRAPPGPSIRRKELCMACLSLPAYSNARHSQVARFIRRPVS
jgi:phosphoribosylaminoimidazole-succinocarboxamide synthase